MMIIPPKKLYFLLLTGDFSSQLQLLHPRLDGPSWPLSLDPCLMASPHQSQDLKL